MKVQVLESSLFKVRAKKLQRIEEYTTLVMRDESVSVAVRGFLYDSEPMQSATTDN